MLTVLGLPTLRSDTCSTIGIGLRLVAPHGGHWRQCYREGHGFAEYGLCKKFVIPLSPELHQLAACLHTFKLKGTVPVRTTFYLCHSTLQAKALYTVFRLLKSLPATTFPNNIIKPDLAPHISALAEFSQKRLYKFKGSPFIDMLGMLRDHLASDDHDKVYAGLGFTIGTNLSIPINYNKPLSEVLRDAAVSCLRQPPHNLRFLGHAGLIGTAHMPATWMPDWFFPNILTPFPKVPTSPRSNDTNILFNACDIHHQIWTQAGYSELEPSTDGHTLTVHGVLVDYVRTGSVTGGFPNTISSIEDAWHLPNMHKTYSPTGETREQAYLRTLVADLKMVEGEVVGRGGSMYWRNRSKSQPTPGQVDTECLLAQVCIGRRLITTLNHHYIGIAPLHTQPGDAIFMVKYGEVLYIARPTLDGTYHFVGEAYIHGVMDGLVTEQLFNGQGEMQTIEFVPVLGDVANSNESPFAIPGNPVSFKSRDIGHGLLRHEYSNRHENMDFKVHDNLGRQMHDEIKDAIDETMERLTDSTTVEEATRKICVECVWALDLKRKLLSSEDEKIEPKFGVCLYGRQFARRSYILAAIDLEIERTRVAILGEFGNLAPYKAGLHVLDVETIENEKQQDAGLKEDEALARELQAQEFISAGLLEDPRNGGTGPILPPQTRQPARLRLLQRRTGPPARLMMAESRNPYTFAYQFRSKEDHALFLQDLQQWTPPRPGLLQRPILVGCWATDPLRRPRVIVQTSGPPPDIWWEDEDGKVVDGPNVGVEGGRLEISDRHDKRGKIDVIHDDWEGEGEAELPFEFEFVE